MTKLEENKARQVRADAAALLALDAIGSEWRAASALARELGAPWRPMAFALRRLVGRGLVCERIVEYHGSARTIEQRREYKIAARLPWPEVFVPRVKSPIVHAGRVVRGRAGLWEPRWADRGLPA